MHGVCIPKAGTRLKPLLATLQNDRPTRAVTLKDKSVVMLYNIDGEVYCSDANSTAFQYPLTHAKIVPGMHLWPFLTWMVATIACSCRLQPYVSV